MRILCLDYGQCNFHNLISLAKDGHEVYVNFSTDSIQDEDDYLPRAFYAWLNLTIVSMNRDSLIIRFVKEMDIDLVLSTSPQSAHLSRVLPNTIGLTPRAAEFEYNKLDTRHIAESLGLNVPPLAKIVNNIVPIPSVEKPIVVLKHHQTASIHLTDRGDKISRESYYEEYLSDGIETNVAYVMAKGDWSIMHIQRILGEDVAKIANEFTHWTKTSSFESLSPENYNLALSTAETYLDRVSLICTESSYVGQITGLIKDGVWYFLENNVRPEQTCSLPYFISGNDWLDSMQGNPHIIGDAFPQSVHKMIVLPREPNSEYPFYLHEKYSVAIPCGLDIVEGKYYVSKYMQHRSSDNRIGIVICDSDIPEEFFDAFMENPDWEITSRL